MDEARLLAGLDAQQRQAVRDPAQPLCIVAGAGSGKTRVLTRRIAYRCLTGTAEPQHVLAVTFTRKAAREMGDRLGRLGLRPRPWVGTFHSIAWWQLRRLWGDRGWSQFELLENKLRLVSNLPQLRPLTPIALATEIEWARARQIPPSQYEDAAKVHDRKISSSAAHVAWLYDAYEAEKRRQNKMDFDDILERCAAEYEANPEWAAGQRWRHQHLFVDEFQDVNALQYRLLRAWLGDRDDLCVVGDARQAIYRWNGADARYLLDFERLHPTARTVELTANYRSSPQVLHLAAAALGDRHIVRDKAMRGPGEPPVITEYPSERAEAQGVAVAARLLRPPGGLWSRQAVLVRTNAQLLPIEEAFIRERIPVSVRGVDPLLQRREVREVLKELTRDPGRSLRVAIEDLDEIVREAEDALVPDDLDDEEQDAYVPPLARVERLESFSALLRLANVLADLEKAATISDLRPWLAMTVGADDVSDRDAVTLSTFHAAKGLEWPIVHIAGLEDGYVPISYADTPEAEEEERRLLHVAITRAEEVVRCSWAATRSLRGRDPSKRRPSPFLEPLHAAVRTMESLGAPADPGPALRRARETLAGAEARTHDDDAVLLGELRAWRDRAARAAGVPGAVVLSDRTLAEVARTRPADREALAAVRGLGPMSVEAYGDDLLRTVRDHAPAGRAS